MSAPRLDLKLRLSLRVAALAALCFAVAAAYLLFETDRAARARADWVAEMVAKDLVLQQGQIHWIKGAPIQFPDLQRTAAALMAPGLCIAYRTSRGETLQRLCSGVAPGDTSVPQLFADLYRRLFDAGRESAHPVSFGNEAHGEAVASIDPQSLIGRKLARDQPPRRHHGRRPDGALRAGLRNARQRLAADPGDPCRSRASRRRRPLGTPAAVRSRRAIGGRPRVQSSGR